LSARRRQFLRAGVKIPTGTAVPRYQLKVVVMDVVVAATGARGARGVGSPPKGVVDGDRSDHDHDHDHVHVYDHH
jgi:hypothetical protein